jgi:hypothetical protein
VTLSRHDLSLVAIALPLVVASLLAAISPVGLFVALGLGSVPSTGGVGYALLVDPPDG